MDGTIKVWNMKTSKENLTIRPFEANMDRPIGIVNFHVIAADRLLATMENGTYVVLNDLGQKVSSSTVQIANQIEEKDSEFVTSCLSPHKQFGYFLTKSGYLYCYRLNDARLTSMTKLPVSHLSAMSHHPTVNMLAGLSDCRVDILTP